MQEDKNLKELLTKWGMETPSADFTSSVMQRVTAAYHSTKPAMPLLKQKIPQLLLAMFLLVCIALLALSCTIAAAALPFHFTVQLPAKSISQSLSFLLVFWIVVLLNVTAKKLFPLSK